MKLIPLTQGQFAMVDDEDYEALSVFNWHAVKAKRTYYASRYIRSNGKDSNIYMHRELLGIVGSPLIGDHIDHNGLNNQRKNIRSGDVFLNMRNTSSRIGSSSKFVGVCWHKKDRKWQAAITTNGRQIHIGQFDSEYEAALARDVVAKRIQGEAANLNVLK